MENKMLQKQISSKEDFFNYLTNLGLFRWSITETPSAYEAIISENTKPKLKNFTNVLLRKDGTYWVRLSKLDCSNKEILSL